MKIPKPVSRLYFEKKTSTGVVRCEVQVFDEPGAYITGDEIEMIFEEGGTLDDAIKYLEAEGYSQYRGPV